MIDDAVQPKIKEQERVYSSLQASGLAKALACLDRRIEHALKMLPAVFGSDAAGDQFRGMHISPQDVATMLGREPGTPLFILGDEPSLQVGLNKLDEDFPRLAWLARVFSLSSFDLDVLLLALAPEVDLRYERLYAYLQDDVSRRLPSVELALNLLCATFDEKLNRRAHFTSHATLINNDILHIVPDPARLDAPFLAQNLKLDAQIVQFLLGVPGLDQRLLHFCEMVQPSISLQDLPYPAEFKQTIHSLLSQSLESRHPLGVYFQGPPGSGGRYLAEALASDTNRALLVGDISRIPQTGIGFETSLKLLFRQAWFQDAILYIYGLDELFQEDHGSLFRRFQEILAAEGRVTLMAGEGSWRSLTGFAGVTQVPFHLPESNERQAWWSACLSKAGVHPDPASLEALSVRFRLSPGQIETAVMEALGKARWRQVEAQHRSTELSDPQPELTDLFAAARAQTGLELARLVQKIRPRYTWDSIVLPADSLAQLRELCQWVVQRGAVLDGWGFERKLSLGKGITALFAGPSGTGKTMAAEIIANELGLDLYRINLSTVISKYIGETEKNLERIFTAAENANAILFFDEADALFGKRSEVRDSHDRYANLDISYLLQRMEQYSGIAILASNLRQNLDEAFTRRLAFIISFPFPDEDHRQRIWQGVFPVETPVDKTLDLPFMARQFKLSGGNIKNIALSAAFLAAADGGQVTMAHLFHATQREYQKLGKVLSALELYGALKEATS